MAVVAASDLMMSQPNKENGTIYPRVSHGTLSALICSHANLRPVTRAMGKRVPSGLNLGYMLHVYCPGICVFDHLYIKFDNHWSRFWPHD